MEKVSITTGAQVKDKIICFNVWNTIKSTREQYGLDTLLIYTCAFPLHSQASAIEEELLVLTPHLR